MSCFFTAYWIFAKE